MEKETVLAKLHVTMAFSESATTWFDKANKLELWFAKEQGAAFFREFHGTWDKTLVESCEPLVQNYFHDLGYPQDRLPHLRVFESYAGSWIIEAAITMLATVGTTYTILKGLSELSNIADGLTKLKGRLKKEFMGLATRNVREHLLQSSQNKVLPPPPRNLIVSDFVIDTSPLLSLTKEYIITKEEKTYSELLSFFKTSIERQGNITTERHILFRKIMNKEEFNSDVKQHQTIHPIENPLDEKEIGTYRNIDKRKSVTADMEIIKYHYDCLKKPCPSFLEAGPRKHLYFEPKDIRIGIVTPGGIAPGLNTVVHCIVKMHEKYGMRREAFGFKGGFRGIANSDTLPLNSTKTQDWIHKGGTNLFTSRGKQEIKKMVDSLQFLGINILYVVGGDGSLNGGHLIAKYIEEHNITVGGKKIVIVGIPKTMDNDILWVWHSFGFDTTVEEATKAINTIHDDAKSTERVCIMQLFGRDAGFVAAHAALASGQVDAVLVPEVEFETKPLIDYIKQKVRDKQYALIVVAEGASPKEYTDGFIYEILRREGYENPHDLPRTHPRLSQLLAEGKLIYLKEEFKKGFMKFIGGRHVVFDSQPRHLIRAVPAGSVDQIYCQRLADLAVHNALAGFTDFMISQWLTEYVLIPLKLVCEEVDPNDPNKRLTKKIVPDGIFWATVISSTGQPSFID